MSCYQNLIIQGYYEFSIVGSGDWISLACWLGEPEKSIPSNSNWKESFTDTIHDYAEKASELKKSVGYVEGLLCHYFHGSKDDRKYYERSTILNDFNPNTDIKKDENGMLSFAKHRSGYPKLRDNLIKYFSGRKEDKK